MTRILDLAMACGYMALAIVALAKSLDPAVVFGSLIMARLHMNGAAR